MILASTALALAGSLFIMGAQSAHISTLTLTLHLSLWLMAILLVIGAIYLLNRHGFFKGWR